MLEIHVAKNACGLDGHDLEDIMALLWLVFRELPFKITVYQLEPAAQKEQTQIDHRDDKSPPEQASSSGETVSYGAAEV